LTGFEAIFGRKRGAAKNLLPAVAVLCLLLLAMLAVAQVAHLHSNPTDSDHCQLCIAMQTAAPIAIAAAAIVLVPLGASSAPAIPAAVVCRFQSKLFIRPPPVSC
jgi:uncharacterized membrane protein YqhA